MAPQVAVMELIQAVVVALGVQAPVRPALHLLLVHLVSVPLVVAVGVVQQLVPVASVAPVVLPAAAVVVVAAA
jgi:hypothetical protein